MVCRGLMLLLDRDGLITLPDKKRELTWLREKRDTGGDVDTAPLECPLSGLPTDLVMVRRTPDERLYQNLIRRYHYLGYTRPVGEHLEYIAFFRKARCLHRLLIAPRHIGERDRYLGWNKDERTANLHKIAINTRFLIPPGSRFLIWPPIFSGRMAKGSPVRLGENLPSSASSGLRPSSTPQRGFTGTCYKAANWHVPRTHHGEGKNDQTGKPNRSLKYVFGYPLQEELQKGALWRTVRAASRKT